MSVPRRSETCVDRGEWVIPRADRIDRPRAVVAASVMLDVLVGIKMDLKVGTHSDDELHHRVNRACASIEAAIDTIKRASDPRAGDQRKSERPIEFDPA